MLAAPNVQALLHTAVEQEVERRGRVNILIAGKSGVGKSTLINAVFGDEVAKTGQGRPVSQGLNEYRKEGSPLSIIDSQGFELDRFEAIVASHETMIQERQRSLDPNDHVHIAWVCLAEDSRRVEAGESSYVEMLRKHMPVVVVITKARSDRGFKEEVARLMPGTHQVLRVRAISEELDEGIKLAPMGLDELTEVTNALVPLAHQRAFAAAQRRSVELRVSAAREALASMQFLSIDPEARFWEAILRINVSLGVSVEVPTKKATEPSVNLLILAILALTTGGALAGLAIRNFFKAHANRAACERYIYLVAGRLSDKPDAPLTQLEFQNLIEAALGAANGRS